MTKQEIRLFFIEKRKSLSVEDLVSKSEQISKNFFAAVDLSAVKYLHSFLPIMKNHEPDTWIILNHIRENYPRVTIILPKINAATQEVDNFIFQEKNDLIVSSWGIAEPSGSSALIDPQKIDMILVPLLAFDKSGHRVGYGKGYYDKLLKRCRPDAERIGISLFENVDKIDDVSPFDVPLHRCVTPTGMIRF